MGNGHSHSGVVRMQAAVAFQEGNLMKTLENMFKHFDLVIKVLGIYLKKRFREFHKNI